VSICIPRHLVNGQWVGAPRCLSNRPRPFKPQTFRLQDRSAPLYCQRNIRNDGPRASPDKAFIRVHMHTSHCKTPSFQTELTLFIGISRQPRPATTASNSQLVIRTLKVPVSHIPIHSSNCCLAAWACQLMRLGRLNCSAGTLIVGSVSADKFASFLQ
jgi:hypothetical protein